MSAILSGQPNYTQIVVGMAMEALEVGEVPPVSDIAGRMATSYRTAERVRAALCVEFEKRRRVSTVRIIYVRPLSYCEQRVFDALVEAGGATVGFADLAAAVVMTRNHLGTVIVRLRRKGVRIDTVPRVGYALSRRSVA